MIRNVNPSPESMAIIGIGLRYPGGAHDAESFWQLMCDRVDAITEIPEDRWSISKFHHPTPGAAGKTYSKWGGFIDQHDQFDARLFGISKSEAENMDPQQRLLLEASWHALEDAGHPVDRSEGDDTGMFVGVSTGDYCTINTSLIDHLEASPFSATGGARSIAANRVSHALNLRGPSVAFDTACSSSLVALHYACASLHSGDCRQALVGGVNFILDPNTWAAFCGMTALSRDGRCKSFDAAADGFVRSEGVGVVLLKPLHRAIADGDRIYASVRSTSCNQDGRTPAIAMPDQVAQESLIRDALQRANLEAGDIAYVESHGTGTAVGDPIEARAIGNVLGNAAGRGAALGMGSVKTNIGHLESGAGMAGLIKTALVLSHRRIPPNLHFNEANPGIDFDKLNLRIPTEIGELNPTGGSAGLFASVNSFGFGGTNAHAILEAGPSESCTRPTPDCPGELPLLLTISAQTPRALEELVKSYSALLESGPAALSDICSQSITCRSLLRHRILVTGETSGDFQAALGSWLDKTPDKRLIENKSPLPGTRDIAFVFSGQGSQWHAMGRDLYGSNQTFRAKINRCRDLILGLGGFDLIEELMRDGESSRIQNTEIAQPAIFAIQVALVDVWKERGVVPAAVVGHSVGEVAAAHVAGALTLEQAVRVIYHRGDTMGTARGGKMIAVGISAAEALTAIETKGDALALAAINGPESVSISGDADALEEIVPSFEAQGVFCRYVPVEYAFHSAQMNPVEAELRKRLAGLEPSVPTLPIYSTVSGGLLDTAGFDAEYWWHNVRETVRFAPAIDQLIKAGFSAFLEIGSHPVLKPSLQQCVAKCQPHTAVIAYSQHKAEAAEDSLFVNLGNLFGSGCRVDLRCFARPVSRRIPLPAYPFDRETFWKESQLWATARREEMPHPFLHITTREPGEVWHFWPDFKIFPYLKDHVVNGNIIMPGAAYVEMALAMASQVLPGHTLVIEELELKLAFALSTEKAPPAVRISMDETASSFRIESCSDLTFSHWRIHAEGGIRATSKILESLPCLVAETRKRCDQGITPASAYEMYAGIGLDYGPSFQTIKTLHVGDGEALAEVRIDLEGDPYGGNYLLHPTLLDAAFQTVLAIIPQDAIESGLPAFLPVWIDRLRFQKKGGDHVFVHARLTRFTPELIEASLLLVTADGDPVAKLDGFRCQKVQGISRAREEKLKHLEVRWELSPLRDEPDRIEAGSFIPDPEELGDHLEKEAASTFATTRGAASPKTLAPMSRLCEAYIIAAFVELGFPTFSGQRFDWKSILETTKVAGQHHALFRQFIRYLTASGVFSELGEDQWKLEQDLRDDLAPEALRELLRVQPSATSEIFLFTLVSEHLVDALQGTTDILPILFHSQNSGMLERLYSGAVSPRVTVEMIKSALRQVSAVLPAGRTLRVLEIGAGTGASAQHYLNALPDGRHVLTFTDVSNAFFSNAEKKFQDFPGIVYRTLDISKPPVEQDFLPHYDIVIAVDVMHATENLGTSIGHVRQLLRPGGMFFVVDFLSRRHITFDLIFGLTKGAWLSADDPLRNGSLGLLEDEWKEAFKSSGFENVTVVRDCPSDHEALRGVFICKAPEIETSSAQAPLSEPRSRHWLILGDNGGQASRLSDQLHALRQSTTVMPARDWIADHLSIINRAREIDGLAGIIYLGALDAADSTPELTTAELEASEEFTVHQPVEILQKLIAAHDITLPGGVWLVTRGALHVQDAEQPNITHTPLQGLGRVVFNEIRDLPLRLIDLSTSPQEGEWRSLANEICAAPENLGREEDQIAFRGDGRFLPRCHRTGAGAGLSLDEVPLHDQACKVTSTRFGALSALCVEACERKPPAPGEVEVRIHAAGLNFRDVMKALKIYPTTIGDAQMLGDDFAGEIVAVGGDVTRFAIGDRVCGATLGAFRSYWTGAQDRLCKIPHGMTYEESATIPTVYNTAYHALHDIGRIRKGERILIHSAAGGVGYAAVRLAQLAGAEVFATAGTSTKRKILGHLGVRHVFNSRTLEFADEIMDATRGEGIDIVLNALAGDAIPKSLKCLRIGGRFLEIGKRDIYENTKLGLRPFMNALTFSSIDLGYGMQQGHGSSRLRRLERLMADGGLLALPYSPFPFGDPASAFRFMSQGRHFGKIVLTLTGQSARIRLPDVIGPAGFDGNQTAIITGGTSGLGIEIAKQYLDQGIRNFVLVSRSGRRAGNAALDSFVQSAEASGATVRFPTVDVSDEQGVADLLTEIRNTMPPVQVVVHSVYTLADELFVKLTRGQFIKGMRAKVSGAWNLHRLTDKDPLLHFIVISSLVSVIGPPGQANYVAANLFLEQLIHLRRAQGLPGLAAKLDMINDTGFISRSDDVKDFFKRSGWAGITGDEAARGIALLAANGASVKAVYKTKFLRNNTLGIFIGAANRFKHILEEDDAEDDAASQRLKNRIAVAPPQDRFGLARTFLREQVAKVLRVPVESISASLPLNEQGLDSLMAVEFVTLLERQLAITVPTTHMTNAPTIDKLSIALLELLTGEKAVPTPVAVAPANDVPLPTLQDTDTAGTDLTQLSNWLATHELTFGMPLSLDRVLLTGANGLLGIYLMRELLGNTEANITCLVRAADSAEGERRLRDACERYQLDWRILENTRDRWTILCGDIEKPGLGLDDTSYRKLADSIDVIFHGAAKVSHVAGYASLRQANVLGTLEIIRLAGTGTPKALHFASSVAVYSWEGEINLESLPPADLGRIHAGYGQTKAICEHLIRQAAQLGLPANVYRIGPVVGDDQAGVTAHHDFIWLLLKACIVLGKAPSNDWNLYLTPVDFAARLLRESYANGTFDRTMNFVNPSEVSLNDLFNAARRSGFEIAALSLMEWAELVREVGSIPAFAPYLFFRKEMLDEFISYTTIPRLQTDGIEMLMESASVQSVPMDQLRIDRFVRYLIESGFLPQPMIAK